MLRHNGELPPSVTQRRAYEEGNLPDVHDLQAHLEHRAGPSWAHQWGNMRFYDETIRILGKKEAELRAYVSQLWQQNIINAYQVPQHYNKNGERKDGYLSLAANHVTAWGRPVANLWFVGSRLVEVHLGFEKPEPLPPLPVHPFFARRGSQKKVRLYSAPL